MEFHAKDYICSLYEASKSAVEGQALMDVGYRDTNVYQLDKVKEWFCRAYRNGEVNLKSCDAYYQDKHKNYLVIEFKNTPHQKLKSYMGEIAGKCMDTHMILAETFLRKCRAEDIGKAVKLCLVYNDGVSYGKGIQGFCRNLNNVKPKKGNGKRKSKEPELYGSEEEFEKDVQKIKSLYGEGFYCDIMFMEKKEFCKSYAESNYFRELI